MKQVSIWVTDEQHAQKLAQQMTWQGVIALGLKAPARNEALNRSVALIEKYAQENEELKKKITRGF